MRCTRLVGLAIGLAASWISSASPQAWLLSGEPLPNVIYPDSAPDQPRAAKPGTGTAGTGFFIASDGTLLTAAHVVADGCRETRILSRLVKPAVARLLGVDSRKDIALLRASEVKPPATLPIGRPADTSGRLFVLGYPTGGGPLVPTETWADLENGKLPKGPADLTDAGQTIWVEAPEINHGFSGGPMLDPRNGTVVGIVRAMIDTTRLHAQFAAIPPSGVANGPGSDQLLGLLRQEGAEGDATPAYGDEAIDAARRATVHVVCLH